jgi:hypothetical protein
VSFSDLPVRIAVPLDYPLDVEPVVDLVATVKVMGPEDALEGLGPENIELHVTPPEEVTPEGGNPTFLPILYNFVDVFNRRNLRVTIDPTSVGVKVVRP